MEYFGILIIPESLRQEEAKPILENFKNWLSKKSLQTPPKGLLGKAVSYALNQWHRLEGYIEDGHLTIDNNLAENRLPLASSLEDYEALLPWNVSLGLAQPVRVG